MRRRNKRRKYSVGWWDKRETYQTCASKSITPTVRHGDGSVMVWALFFSEPAAAFNVHVSTNLFLLFDSFCFLSLFLSSCHSKTASWKERPHHWTASAFTARLVEKETAFSWLLGVREGGLKCPVYSRLCWSWSSPLPGLCVMLEISPHVCTSSTSPGPLKVWMGPRSASVTTTRTALPPCTADLAARHGSRVICTQYP